MSHINYFEIKASSYYDLGLQEGKLFRNSLINSVNKSKTHKLWESLKLKSKTSLNLTQDELPHLIEELQGYAKGAGVSFEDLWLHVLKIELAEIEKCTSVITNNGKLVAHNEDWDAKSKDAICVMKKSVGDLTIFELFYLNSLGGNAISVNSNGIIQSINTLTHTDKRVGIPRNLVARWTSETKNPELDFPRFSTLQRSSGYSHNFVNIHGKAWNIESSANKCVLKNVSVPFVHTNHFLTELKEYEKDRNFDGTLERYNFAFQNTKKDMSLNDIQTLMSDNSNGAKISLLNERTIARMIVDLEKFVAYVWLLREVEKGWVEYDMDFIR